MIQSFSSKIKPLIFDDLVFRLKKEKGELKLFYGNSSVP